MIGVSTSGSFKNTSGFLNKLLHGDLYSELSRYGQMGVDALANATPIDTGESRAGWGYRILKGKRPGIEWYNDHMAGGVPVVILIQYGHGTGTGGYVQGRDFINKAIQPIFDQIADNVWKKVKS